jgi:hypothetical protein
MKIEIGLTHDELTNTRFAPLAVLFARYQQNNQLERLQKLALPMRQRGLWPAEKLTQVLFSIMAGCQTLSEVNSKLRSETILAKALGWTGFTDQSTLSRTLDALRQKQIEELRQGVDTIRKTHSPLGQRDWRSYLWLDFDLTGLPCGAQAEESQKGYFGDKKMLAAGSWLA